MEKKLNESQLRAVTHGQGPLLIIAGAGTGKTTVITERVKHLISEGLAKPSEILALTFTEKAAMEMEGRIDEALPLGYAQMWVMTFHSFCDRILRQDGFHIGIDTKFRLMTTADSVNLLKRNLYSLGLDYFAPLGNPTKFINGLLSHFSRLQDENITPEEYLSWSQKFEQQNAKNSEEEKLESQKWSELSRVYQEYEALKIKNSLFDFGDLITKTIALFEKRPNVLAEYQKKFKYILVDEFQDTNYAQNRLVTLLAGKAGNITVVGDDDQSIYRFRGAAVSNMLQFRDHFPTTTIVTLTDNYRSKQTILDAAHTLISHNNPDRLEVIERIDKRLVSHVEGLGKIELIHPTQSTEEADFVSQKILELQEKYLFSDFAVLVRANNHAESFVRSFEQNGIPYQFLGPGKLFNEPEIVDLISYLRVLADIHNDAALYRVLSSEVFELEPLFLAKISSKARHEQLFLFDSLEIETKTELTGEKITEILTLITDHLKRSRDESVISLLLEYLDKSGLREYLIRENSILSLKKIQNIEKFLGKIKSFEIENKNATLLEIVDWIDLQTEINESPAAAELEVGEEDKVNILTVHSSKGLEFPVVFLVNLVSQRFPSMERSEQIPIPEDLIREVLPSGDFHLQEERRLFYVGLTRAKNEVYLTGAKFYGDGKREKKLSSFVNETLGESLVQTPVVKLPSQITAKTTQTPESKLRLKSISFSQIETFKVCPLHYKLHYLLKIPTPPSPAQSFGVSFHAALKEFHDHVSQGETPSKALLQQVLNENWLREGYSSKEHIDKAHQKASKFLDYYFDNWFDTKTQTVALEQPFSFRLDNLSVKGKIDRVDEVKGGIHIIDYKTGSNAFTQKEADSSLQLSIYALAATKIPDTPFDRTPSDITLSLYYFDTKEIVTTHRTATQLKEAEEEILEWALKIEQSDFTCSGNFLCGNCEYKSYCATSLESSH